MSINDYAGLLSEAVFDDSALVPALEMLSGICGSRVCQFVTTTPSLSLIKSSFGGDMDPDAIAAEPDYWDVNPRAAAIPKMVPGRAVLDHDIIDRDAMRHNPAYQELLIPARVGKFAGIVLKRDSTGVDALALHRDVSDEDFSRQSIETFELAGQISQTVIALSRRMAKRTARSVFDTFPANLPMAFLDSDGRLLDHNEAFGSHLLSAAVSLTPDRKVRFADAAASQKLRQHLCGSHAALLGGHFLCSRLGEDDFLFAEVMPVPKRQTGTPSRASHLLTLLHRRRPRLDTDIAQDAFGLTPAEADVAALLVSGLTVGQIASGRGVSINTIRSLLKRVFEKTDCNSQVELLAKLNALSRNTDPGCDAPLSDEA